MTDYFTGLATARATPKGINFDKGFVGEVRILETKAFTHEQKGPAFIVKVEILESNQPAEAKVGDHRDWYVSMADRTMALPNVKKFLLAVLGFDLSRDEANGRIKAEFDPICLQLANECGDPLKNPLKGFRVKLRTVGITTVKKGMPFTRHDWIAVSTGPVQ